MANDSAIAQRNEVGQFCQKCVLATHHLIGSWLTACGHAWITAEIAPALYIDQAMMTPERCHAVGLIVPVFNEQPATRL